ncbi:hypothetical protein N7457_005337 [Penicillium paradoxum]|uniref:uncharacterized protein n=1 Tax=Penicillium paradoxum TaxID=176176 RepID=UPI00254668C8|nr:uncharacterized protein N7457_005337 [Penicillium paradoxum]KAJ5780177.1 hypothetical protein N7457_005337 [Penicillium paradoxum]
MVHPVAEDDNTKPFNPKDDDFATSTVVPEAALDSCDGIQHSSQLGLDTNSSFSDHPASPQESSSKANDVEINLPEIEGPKWTPVNSTTKQDDPGPSVRRRTAAELKEIMEKQVEHPEFSGLDAITLTPLLSAFLTRHEKQMRDMHPERTEVDWLSGRPRPLKSPVTRRATLGQMCGVQGPPDEKCTNCAQEKGPFKNCRVLFMDNHIQWSWACICCVYRTDAGRCSLRPDRFLNVPSWVAEAVTRYDPTNKLLPIYHAGKKEDAVAPIWPDANGKWPPKATLGGERPQKKRRIDASAQDFDGRVPGKLKNGGLDFNDTWYRSPIEDPDVYRMKDKTFALTTYHDIAQILERVKEDHQRLKLALLEKGFLDPLDEDEEMEDENVFAK